MNSLCGASLGESLIYGDGARHGKGITQYVHITAPGADPYVYKVCYKCRRTAEARKKRQARKPDPSIKAAKLRAEEEKREREAQEYRERLAAEEAEYKRRLMIRLEDQADRYMAMIDEHYGIPLGQAKREGLRAAILGEIKRRHGADL